jgi:tyrosine-protein phosphatase YwqE
MVHTIASDAHDAFHRPRRLDAAWHRVKQEFGELTAKKLLIDNPCAMIQGAEELSRKPAASTAFDHTQVRESWYRSPSALRWSPFNAART